MHFVGLPLHGSPLAFLRSPLVILPAQFLRPAKTSRPHPSRKGGGQLWQRLRLWLQLALVSESTSLTRGEGLVADLLCVVEREAES